MSRAFDDPSPDRCTCSGCRITQLEADVADLYARVMELERKTDGASSVKPRPTTTEKR